MPVLLKIGFDYVDARDVADLHILAMESAGAAGQRFIASAEENLTYKGIADILRRRLGGAAKNVSGKEVPDAAVRLLSLFIKPLRMPATFLGQNTACSSAKAKTALGW